jgi:hypothetical protein
MPLDPKIPLVLSTPYTPYTPQPGVRVPGDAVFLPCAGCGTSLILAPSSAAIIGGGVAQPACPKCAIEHYRQLGQIPVAVMTADQAADLRRYETDHAKRK